MKILYSDDCVQVVLHDNGYRTALEVNWLNRCTGEELQRATVQAIMLARRHQVNAWIANDQGLGKLSLVDMHWAEQMLENMHRDLGLDRFALLMSDLPHNREKFSPYIQKYTKPHSPLELNLFEDIGTARAWALDPQ
ncbi:hypothetical protein [Hymenobacter oligotrophus]|nr:hypothetical protein [Hymenobacter oligotrophus]